MKESAYKVGLTGLIGSGKSQAATYFANLGINVIDTDAISHEITNPTGIAIPHMIKAFGKGYITPDGALDRSLMRELVFHNKQEKHKLELILHPLIFDEVEAQLSESKSLYTIIVVPLLFQSPRYSNYVVRSIFVDCNEDTIVNRVMKRNGWTQETVQAVLNNQMSRMEQLKLANDVLDNNKTLCDLELQVQSLHEKYTKLLA